MILAPVVVFFGFHIRAMSDSGYVDPFFYTGYAQNGPDLIERFGPNISYFWARVGFVLPARLAWAVFGSVGGFYAFRYGLALIATAPAYLLFRRLYGRGAGVIAVLTLLTSPVLLIAWSTDYPDSSAVSYLTGGLACLFMPAVKGPRRGWVALGVGLFVLAVNSHPVAIYTVGVAAIVYALVFSRLYGRELLALLGAALAGAAVSMLLLIGASWSLLGQVNFLGPTFAALDAFGQAGKIAAFHSTTWKWLLYETYLVVPLAVVAAWAVQVWRDRRPAPGQLAGVQPEAARVELALALITSLAFAVHAYEQFGGKRWTLEVYLGYSSVLFCSATLLWGALLVRLARSAGAKGWRPWVLPVLAVLAIPVLLRPFRDLIQFELPVALALAAVLIAVPILRGGRSSRTAGALMVAVAVASVYLITTGEPLNPKPFPGQVTTFIPDYGTALFGYRQQVVDEYVVATKLATVVPPDVTYPGRMIMWWGPRPSSTVSKGSAMYLWVLDALPPDLPALTRNDIYSLRLIEARFVVILASDGSDFGPALRALKQSGFNPQVFRQADLRSGEARLDVLVVQL